MKRLVRICKWHIIAIFLFTGLLSSQASRSQMRQIYSDLSTSNNDIQKLSFYSPSAGFIASTDNGPSWVGFTTDSGRTISKRPITNSNVNFNGYSVNLTFGFGIRGVKAFNQDTLLAWGDYGLVPAILYSTNGGQNFLLVFHSQIGTSTFGELQDLAFFQNSNTGLATDGYRIMRTTDRGLNWSVVLTDGSAPFDALDMADNTTAFCFSRNKDESPAGKLMKTINGGQNWQQLTIPDPHIFSADFINSLKGWINVYERPDSLLLYHTTDGGQSWVKKNNGRASGVLFDKIQFVNDSTGYGIGPGFFTYKTSDTGRVWEPLERNNNFEYFAFGHNDLQIINASQLWSGGTRDFLEINTQATSPALPKAYFAIDTAGVNNSGFVKLFNYSKRNYQYKWIVNNVQISTNYDASYSHTLASPVDSIVLIVSNGSRSDTVKKYQYFIVPDLPVITSFSPTTGSTGTSVLIYGSSFSGVTAVRFGGIPAASFTILNNNVIRAIVGSGASGMVSVTDIHGTYSLGTFLYTPPPVSPPPAITSFSPASGPVGTTLTINGQNFATDISGNAVSFGAVEGTIVSASSTQIICTVPAGATYVPVSVLNKLNGLSGRSARAFNITFADSTNFTTSSFAPAYTLSYFPTGDARYANGCDFDRDGKPDLLFTKSRFGDSLVVLRNTAPAAPFFAFGTPVTIGAASGLSDATFVTADLDGDGKKDIAGATNADYLYIYKNQSTPGNISFSPRITVAETGPGTHHITAADFDGDGRPDFAVSAYNNQTLVLHRNTSSPGNLSFAYRIEMSAGGFTLASAAADLDGDGKEDIVTLNYNGATPCSYSIFKNQSITGTISFSTATTTSINSSALSGRGIWLTDYDNDSKPDILITADNGNYFLRNTSTTGTISFAAAVVLAENFISPGAVAGLNGDSKPDFIYGTSSFSLLQNNSVPGTISNLPYVRITNDAAGSYTSAIVDFNLDGKPDIVSCESNQNKLTIFENRTGATFTLPFSYFTCSGSFASRMADLSGTTYQWQQNANDGNGFVNLTNNSTFSGVDTRTLSITGTPLSFNGYLYRCVVDGNLYSSRFLLTVYNTVTPSVTISTPSTTVCSGAPVTFTATTLNTGPATSYNWMVNGSFVGNDNPVFTTSTLTNGSVVRVYVSNPCGSPNSVFSNSLIILVNGGTPQVSIAPASPTLCAGTPVTFTATPVNGGATPFYQWKINGTNTGTNSNTYTSSSFVTGDQLQVVMTATTTPCGSPAPVSSNMITLNMTNPVTPDITIGGNTTIVTGQFTTITGTTVNAGTAPQYRWEDSTTAHTWQLKTVSAALNLSFSPAQTGYKLRCILISNAACAAPVNDTSNVLTFTVNTATGLNPVNAAQYHIRYFPNPVHQTLYIDSLRTADQWQSLMLITTEGKPAGNTIPINNRATVALPVGHLPAGTYIAVLRRKKGEAVYLKFVKL